MGRSRRANRRNGRRSAPKKAKPRRGRRNTSKAPNKPQAVSAFGRLIASGVRNVVSLLPASAVLTPIADVVLTAIGLGSSTPTINGLKIKADTNTYGLGLKIAIDPAHIMVASKVGWKERPVDRTTVVFTEYKEARLLEIEVSVELANPVGSRTGEWVLALYPFYAQSDRNSFLKDTIVPERILMHQAPYSATGSASLPLRLVYRPRVTDGLAFMFDTPDTERVGVCLRFEDYNRENFSDFKAEEFGVSLVLKGKVELRSATSTMQQNFYTGKITNILNNVAYQCEYGKTIYSVSRDGFVCKASEDGKSCVVKGVLLEKPRVDVPTLESMALE